MSTARAARKIPVSPPIEKTQMKISAYHIGVFSTTDPLYIVTSQLKTLIADGIATLKVIALKIMLSNADWPLVKR